MGLIILILSSTDLCAQDKNTVIPKAQQHREMKERVPYVEDTAMVDFSKMDNSYADSMRARITVEKIDEAVQKTFWVPDPKKSLWYAIIFPGGGQIYNRKYWKLPLIYGGILGCVYALNWNDTMYSDYSRAYIDLMDDNPNTKSYENFLPVGYDIEGNKSRLQTIFANKKDYYRRYRDLSLFCMIGVYGLSILDAYIDAEMMNFDISKDLSMKVRPTVIGEQNIYARKAMHVPNSYGVSLNFCF